MEEYEDKLKIIRIKNQKIYCVPDCATLKNRKDILWWYVDLGRGLGDICNEVIHLKCHLFINILWNK